MKKKSALFLLLIGGTMLSGCIGNPKLEEDTIGEIISEKDPVYDYLQGYVDNVSLVKEKDDGDSKTVWVKTTTEFDNFTYEGSYVIDCGLYSKNGNKEWDVNNFQIDYEDMLMQGLEIVARYPIEELKETPSITQFVQNAENKKVKKISEQRLYI